MSPNVTHSEPNKPYVTFYSFLSRNICYLSIKSVPIQTLQVLVPWASRLHSRVKEYVQMRIDTGEYNFPVYGRKPGENVPVSE